MLQHWRKFNAQLLENFTTSKKIIQTIFINMTAFNQEKQTLLIWFMCLTKKTVWSWDQTYTHWFLSKTKIMCCRFWQFNRDDICMMCSQTMTIQFGKQTTLLQLRHPITVHFVTPHHDIPSSCLTTHQLFLLQARETRYGFSSSAAKSNLRERSEVAD